METSLKTGFAQVFSCYPKNLSCPNFGGAAAPLAPPARTPMFNVIVDIIFRDAFVRVSVPVVIHILDSRSLFKHK